jgi:hypothetical protein
MTSRRPRDIGTHTESAVVRYLAVNGFDNAERRSLRGSLDAGDITGTPGVAWSIKGGVAAKTASDGQVDRWLTELERQRTNAAATIAVLVLQRAGIGEANAGRWWAVVQVCSLGLGHDDPALPCPHGRFPARLHLADACTLLRAAGYGTPLEVTA